MGQHRHAQIAMRRAGTLRTGEATTALIPVAQPSAFLWPFLFEVACKVDTMALQAYVSR